MEMQTIKAKDIADILGCSVRHTKERVTKHPDFPIAFKIGGVRVWLKSEFDKWFMRQREF